jgi:Ca2+-binding RTX toxin-like protein
MDTGVRKAGSSRRKPRIAIVVVGLVALAALLLAPTTAVPEGKIVINGPDFSSHLRISVSNGNVLVNGQMTDNPEGCLITEGHRAAVCPIAGAGGMEIVMGPADDKVEVDDPLPMPLLVRLGAGSDKFIGNEEPDTCYSEGSKRNRCIGAGGDDICITGQQNSDCVGGDGNDFCKHGAGSDGCWGGPGNDICEMGPGMDGCHGGPGADTLDGGPDPDQLYGEGGSDYCDGGRGVGRSHECESGPGG